MTMGAVALLILFTQLLRLSVFLSASVTTLLPKLKKNIC
jgi:hypothetical protein